MASNTESGVQLKSPVAFPPCIPDPPKIHFLHPHYTYPDTLFALQKLDSNSSVSGVHYRTALLACQIVAGNAFNGYLATDRDGDARVTAERDDDLLTGNKYWFIANANNPHDDYPVVPRFEDWVFPLEEEFQGLRWRHPKGAEQDRLEVQPTSSQPAPMTAAQMPPPPRPDPDTGPTYSTPPEIRRCIISNISCLIQSAHVIPQALNPWFERNCMERFGNDALGIHSPSNRVDLRHDLHNAWDRHMFVLVPKQSELTVHVLKCSSSNGTCEFAAQWHNVPARRAAFNNVRDEYLFAKFAQGIFTLLKAYIVRGPSRRVARLKVSADGVWEQSVDKLAGDMLKKEYGGGGTVRSSSASSGRKRSHSQVTQGDSDDAYDDSRRDANSRVHEWMLEQDHDWDGSPVGWHAHEDQDLDTAAETGRGRPRKRRSIPPPRRGQTSDTLPSLVMDDNTSSDAHEPVGSSGPQVQGRYTLPPATSAKSAGGRQEDDVSERAISDVDD